MLVVLQCQAAELEEIQVAAASGSALPHLARASDSTTLLSWVEPSETGHRLLVSALSGRSWSQPQVVAQGERWFVNWADFPSVVPLSSQHWVAHWLTRSADSPYAYDIQLSISQDGGSSWTEPASPHHDNTPTEQGFATIFPWKSGFGMVWLDGRNTSESDSAHGHAGAMTLRSAAFDSQGIQQKSKLVDNRVCDCCQTDVAQPGSVPVVFYRDRNTDEIRDLSFSRLEGEAWATPAPVHRDGWKIAGCPVNGPAASAQGQRAAVAWYTESGEHPRVQLAMSEDAGASFSPPILIDGNRPLGRVDVDFLPDGDVLVSWLAQDRDGQSALTLRRVSPSGDAGPPLAVSRTSATRPSGFPQLLVAGGRIILAWTDVVDGTPRVRSAHLATLPP